MKHSITKLFMLFSMAFTLIVLAKTDVLAENYIDSKYVSYTDEAYVSVKYASNYSRGGGGNTYISLKDGASIANVNSSSPNLLVKATGGYYNISTDQEYDSETYTYTYKRTNRITSANLSYFAKAAGKYTVTFDVLDENGKKVDVGRVTIKTSYPTNVSPIKKVTYAGTEIWSINPYSTKKSGKVKVTMNKGYKLEKILVYNSQSSDVGKKVKNNGKIKLMTSKYVKNDSSYSLYETDALFPETRIEVIYKNKKTKEIDSSSYYIRTINTKQNIK